jgi:hypothetical protein
MDKWIQDASKFAEKSITTNIGIYKTRNQPNIKKGMNDNKVGKVGEEVVHSYLKDKIPAITSPDYAIYKVRNKSWEKDLRDINSDIKVGVKTQTTVSANKYGESWVFQNTDKGIYSDDKTDRNNYIALVLIDLDIKIGIIKAIIRIPWLHNKKLFKPMKLAYLQNNKQAVYYNDLLKYENELWQI